MSDSRAIGDLKWRFSGNPFWEHLLTKPCPQKILLVTDGGLDFSDGGFGLSEFTGLLRQRGHTVSTAHRSGAGPNLTFAGSFDFATANPAVTPSNYDQIWLFGISTAPIRAAEQTAIASFMQAGGGVFATGDHEDLGAGMGLLIPRVRKMRNWASIPMVNPNRHDTVIDPGADGIKQFSDQADAIAQRIYPVFFSNGGPDGAESSWNVHPVLRHNSGAVDALPDHPHESECLAPDTDAGLFANVEEWPAGAGGLRIAANVVAVSMSAGRFVTDTGKPPVLPHSFGAISAYDGDDAGVGRIVCDATWHHFVNINLNGSGAGADANGNPRSGLYVGGQATPEYLKIQRYFLNTAQWLAPRGRRDCLFFKKLALVRFDYEMQEWKLPMPHPCPWDPLIQLGALAEQILTRHWGPGEAADLVEHITQGSKPLARSLKAQRTQAKGLRSEPSLLPVRAMRHLALGSALNVLAEQLPTDLDRLKAAKKPRADSPAESFREGVSRAEGAIAEYLEQLMKQAKDVVKSATAKKG